MNNKGQNQIGLLIMVAITVIVGAIFLTTIAQNVGSATDTVTVQNESIGTVTNGSTVYFTSYRAISSPVIVNGSNGALIGAGNYTATNNIVDPTTGGLSVRIVVNTVLRSDLTPGVWNISGTGQPTTYIAESGGRAVAALITIFFAMAVFVVALIPSVRSEVLKMVSR